jgi:signal transduction histidine kinase
MVIILLSLLFAIVFDLFTRRTPVSLLTLTIFLCAWWDGWKGGLLATVFTTILIRYFFTFPRYNFDPIPADIGFLLVLYLVIGVAVSYLEHRRRWAQRLVEIERHRLKVAFEQFPGGIIVAQAPSGEAIFVNETAKRMTGDPDADRRPMDAYENAKTFNGYHLDGTPIKPTEYPLLLALREGVTTRGKIIRLHRASDDSELFIEANAAPLRERDDEITGGIVFVQDITQRKRVEDNLRALQAIANRLSETLTEKEVAQVIIKDGLALTGASAATIYRRDDENDVMIALEMVGYADNIRSQWEHIAFDKPTSLIALCARERGPVFASGKAQRAALVEYSPHVPQTQHAWAALPLIIDDELIGALGVSYDSVRAFDTIERDLLSALASYCAQALHRAELTERLKRGAAYAERQRLARDLHDAVSQSLFASASIAEAVQHMAQTDPVRAASMMDELLTLNRGALAEMRTLLLELRPDVIAKNPLPELIAQLLAAARSRKGFSTSFVTDDAEFTLPPDVHLALYRMVQESINNIVKHSDAQTVSVTLKRVEGQVQVMIEDDGIGFDSAAHSGGIGMSSMRERAAEIGARFQVESKPGRGTRVIIAWRESVSGAGV